MCGFTSIGVMLPSWELFCLCACVFNFVGVVFTSGRGFTIVGVDLLFRACFLPLWACFYLCMRGFTSVCVVFNSVGVGLFGGRGFTFVDMA